MRSSATVVGIQTNPNERALIHVCVLNHRLAHRSQLVFEVAGQAISTASDIGQNRILLYFTRDYRLKSATTAGASLLGELS
jgi:hypothetical protein